jgi:hypothetical protein
MAFTNDMLNDKKTTRKSSGLARAIKRAVGPSATGQEILFTEEPNPFRPPVAPYIWIDHPTEGERLRGPVYVIRLGVGGADAVEISFDKGNWLPCRYASGYWWYDWTNISSGRHTLVARMHTPEGRWYKTPTRNCERKSG